MRTPFTSTDGDSGHSLHRRYDNSPPDTGPTGEVAPGCDSIEAMTVINTASKSVRFRRSGGVWLASLLTLVFVMPFAGSVFVELTETTRLLLAPVAILAVLIALLSVVWSIRSGVDAGPDGLTVKALLNGRRVPWTEITGFDQQDGKVYAVLRSGSRLELPAVRPVDLPKLVAAGGNELRSEPAEDQ
jgi:hypothetical protein